MLLGDCFAHKFGDPGVVPLKPALRTGGEGRCLKSSASPHSEGVLRPTREVRNSVRALRFGRAGKRALVILARFLCFAVISYYTLIPFG